jgi:hypothetical protein
VAKYDAICRTAALDSVECARLLLVHDLQWRRDLCPRADEVVRICSVPVAGVGLVDDRAPPSKPLKDARWSRPDFA